MSIIKSENYNATTQFPRVFYCRHMQPGTCRYDDETVLVDTDAIKKMLPSGVGKPVYINHQNVKLDDLKEQAAGYITEGFYNELDGWAWFKFLAIDDECHKSIADGWSVSNAYKYTDVSGGGTKNNVPYNKEIVDGIFTHLAIVSNPRYEQAKIFTPDEFKAYQEEKKRQLVEYQNSHQPNPKGKTMFKLFKNEKKEVSTVDLDTMIELENGKSISVKEMLNAVKKNEDEDEKKEKENEDQMVDVDGEKMPLKDLVNKYTNMKKNKKNKKNDGNEGEDEDGDEEDCKNKRSRKNADDEDDDAEEKMKAKAKKEKENAEKDEEEKKNSNGRDIKYFNELRNAHERGLESGEIQSIASPGSALERGKTRY